MNPLREARAKLGLRPEEMAKLLHVSLRTYQRWEAGTKHCPPGVLRLVEMILEKRQQRVIKTGEEGMFKDQSRYQGWLEFETPKGMLRAEDCGAGIWNVYEKMGDCFVMSATIRVVGKKNICQRIFEEYETLEEPDSDDSDDSDSYDSDSYES